MTTTASPGLTCPPRFGTPRNPDRPTLGPKVAKIAELLGTPLMPWQQHVADVALEVDPDTGSMVYREVVITVPRQSGKALDVATPLLTERGWTTMGDVQAGDRVYHPAGHTVEVTHTSPLMLGHDCYQVTTTDGRSVVADADHLWTVQDRLAERSRGPRGARVRSYAWRTLTTRELAETGLMRQAHRTVTTNGKQYSSREFRFRLPIQQPLKSPAVDLPLDPYLLGMWLGDGASACGQITVGFGDYNAVRALLAADGHALVSARRDRTAGTIRPAGLQSNLRSLALLGDKHVPEAYLTAGHDQRLALLQGLLDSDGYIGSGNSGTPRVEFCSTNRVLADAVLYLARSLGWRATLKEGIASLNGRAAGPKWRVCFTPTTAESAPFRLERKRARIGEPRSRAGERHAVSIASIAPVDSRPVRCIKVDSPDGLFLAGRDLLVTHNTTLMLSMMVHRAIGLGRRQRILYTAQTRGAARAKWEDEHVATLERSKTLRKQFTTRKQLGQEAIRWKNGSLHGITANTEKAGHGETLDLGVIDEAFAQEDGRLEQAFKPAMITRVDPQLWVVSTAGTAKSVYLRGKVDLGRTRCEVGVADSVAYFEWSAPDNADPADEAVWWTCMPALGHTVTADAIRADFESMDRKEFRRAYLNQWPDASPDEWLVIGRDRWMALADGDSRPLDPVAFAADVSPARTSASIAVAGHREDGRTHVEIIATAAGTGWVVPRLKDLVHKWGPIAVVVDAAGPAGSLIPELQQAGITVTQPSSRDAAQACGAFFDAVMEDRLRHRDDSALNAALAAAGTRQLKDSWAWARQHPSADITPLVAATLAKWGLTREPENDEPEELTGSLMA